MRILFTAIAFISAMSGSAMAQSMVWQQAAAPSRYFSAATTNSTLVQAGQRVLSGFQATNTTTAVYYLKFYDKATAPTCGTDTPLFTVAIPNQPAGTTVGQIGVWPYAGIAFNSGLGFCITGAAADADTTAAATGITLSLGVK